MIFKYLAERKIVKFLRAIAQALPNRYGGSAPFTEGQVRATMKELGYGQEFEEVGIAVFCSEEICEQLGIDGLSRKKYAGYKERYLSSSVDSPGGSGGIDGGGGD